MKNLSLFLSALLLASTAGSADAALITFNVKGVFSNGAKLGGTFTEDTTKRLSSQNVAITVDNVDTFNSIQGGSVYDTVEAKFYNNSNNILSLSGPKAIFSQYTGAEFNFAFAGGNFDTTSYVEYGGNRFALISGSFVDASAVPEPATWMMLILGMAAVGYAMRRSNVKFGDRTEHMTASGA